MSSLVLHGKTKLISKSCFQFWTQNIRNEEFAQASQKCWLSEILCYALGFKMVLHTSNVRRQGLEGEIIHSLQNHMDSEVQSWRKSILSTEEEYPAILWSHCLVQEMVNFGTDPVAWAMHTAIAEAKGIQELFLFSSVSGFILLVFFEWCILCCRRAHTSVVIFDQFSTETFVRPLKFWSIGDFSPTLGHTGYKDFVVWVSGC